MYQPLCSMLRSAGETQGQRRRCEYRAFPLGRPQLWWFGAFQAPDIGHVALAQNFTNAAPPRANEFESTTESDGVMKVSRGTHNLSEVIAAEETLEFLDHLLVATCMDRYGSYGIRRLFTELYDEIVKNKWDRPEWMAHPSVQRSCLFEFILPMTYASGSSKMEGGTTDVGKGTAAIAGTQTLNVNQQLRLGVRALDFGMVVAKDRDNSLWVACGLLNVELRDALLQSKRFLATHRKEVVFLFAGKADRWASEGFIKDLEGEDENPQRIPGQSIREVVNEVLGEF